MKAWIKVTLCILLSFICLFLPIGYATLTDTLSVTGNAVVNVPDGLFIINIGDPTENKYIDTETISYFPYSTTVESTLNKALGNRNTGTITYPVTVYNNTSQVYAYRDIYYQNSSTSGYNGNDYIITSGSNNSRIAITTYFPNGIEKVYPGEKLEFYVTYTMGSRMNASTNYNTLVNIRFGINVDSEEEARQAVIAKFEDILNSPSTYDTLFNRIDDKFSGAEWTSNYIGNVTDSSSEDSTTVNTLFAGHLQMVIDNVDNPITVLIKHENVDNNRQTGDDYTAVSGSQSFTGYGCEFTLYMTTSKLDDRSKSPPVYAAVFTCDRYEDGSRSDWYMVGEPYLGTAQIVGYEGGESTGSFDTGTWRAVNATYIHTDNYSYTLNSGTTIQQVTQTVDPNAIEALRSLLTEAKEIIDGDVYAGTGLKALEEAYYNANDYYTVSADGTITVDANARRVQLIPHIEAVSHALEVFKNI